MYSSTYLGWFRRLLLLGAVVAGLTASAAGARLDPGVNGVGSTPSGLVSQTTPDSLKADGLPVSAQARLARNYQHEDAIYSKRSARAATPSPADQMGLHFDHEDRVYQTLSSASRATPPLPATVNPSSGFDWNDALVGAGSAVGVLFLAGAAVTIRRTRSHLVAS
jgi:hypothetical protein